MPEQLHAVFLIVGSGGWNWRFTNASLAVQRLLLMSWAQPHASASAAIARCASSRGVSCVVVLPVHSRATSHRRALRRGRLVEVAMQVDLTLHYASQVSVRIGKSCIFVLMAGFP